jgi:3-dehydroquinate synthase class II
MSIKQHLETALANIKAEQERAICIAKEQTMRESVIPKHTEINGARDEAIAKITENYNQHVAKLQAKFNAEKQEVIQAAENKKEEVTNSMIECAIATVKVGYDKTIINLEEQIAKAEG